MKKDGNRTPPQDSAFNATFLCLFNLYLPSAESIALKHELNYDSESQRNSRICPLSIAAIMFFFGIIPLSFLDLWLFPGGSKTSIVISCLIPLPSVSCATIAIVRSRAGAPRNVWMAWVGGGFGTFIWVITVYITWHDYIHR